MKVFVSRVVDGERFPQKEEIDIENTLHISFQFRDPETGQLREIRATSNYTDDGLRITNPQGQLSISPVATNGIIVEARDR